MGFRSWLLAGAGFAILSMSTPAAFAQDANDPALLQAYAAFQAAQDDATQQALGDACVNAGFGGLDDCIAAISGATPLEQQPPDNPVDVAPPQDEPVIEEAPPPDQPVIDTPAPDEPVIEEPTPDEPVVDPTPPDAPAVDETTTAEPVPQPDETVIEEPSSDEPVLDQPQPDQPAMDELSSDEPVMDEPQPDASVIDEPAPADPVAEDASSDEPLIDQPQPDQPATDETPASEPVADDASSDAFGVDSAASDQPVIADQPSDEPIADDPSSALDETPPPDVSETQPIADLPNADEPVTVDAVEVLPPDIAPQDAAPILDSIKDDTNAGDATTAVETPAEPPPPPPQDDRAAQADIAPPQDSFSVTAEQGDRQPADFVFVEPPPPPQVKVLPPPPHADSGVIFQIGINIYINNPQQERSRFYDPGRDEIYYEDLSRGRVRETIVRPNGVTVVTVYDRYGDVLQRSKILPDGREIYLATYNPDEETDFADWRDRGDDLPPLILGIPARDYILDADLADEDQVYDFLDQPPVEQVRRIYSIDEVKRSARLRDMVRRLEVGGLTFDTGKATIDRSQVASLEKIAKAMLRALDKNPGEVFLIEGHTDAVGSALSNLVLSDKRAATVARILTDFYDIPPENLATQGYGERYLKVKTDGPERLNRRVTIKRITPLVSYEASNNR